MKAYTIPSSSRAMSVAREAAGSWTTSAGSLARSSGVMPCLEEIAAHQIARACALHVRSGVDDDVPRAAGGRIGDVVERRLGVRCSLPVGNHLVQRERDAAPRRRGASPDMDVRHVRGVRLQAGYPQLDRHRTLAGGDGDGSGSPGAVDRVELEGEGLGAG